MGEENEKGSCKVVGASVKMDPESSGHGKGEALGAQERLPGHDTDSRFQGIRRIKPRRKRTEGRETKAGTSRVRVPEKPSAVPYH